MAATTGRGNPLDLIYSVNSGLDELMDCFVGGDITTKDYLKGRQVILKARDRSMVELLGRALGDRK